MDDAKPQIEPGQLWYRTLDKYLGTVRVMAVVEDYVMARFKGAVPFIESTLAFQTHYHLADKQPKRRRKFQ